MFNQCVFGNYLFGSYSLANISLVNALLVNSSFKNKVRAVVKLLMALSVLSMLTLAGKVYAGQDLDPTKPFSDHRATSTVKKNARLVLQSIIKRYNSRIAVINNKTLKIGDEIGLYQVVAINSKSVVLNSLQQRIELSLFTNVVAKSQ